MNDAIVSLNDQMKKVTDMQARAFGPMRLFGTLAVETMDSVVRKNYAVMGDMVEFTLKQARLPMNGGEASDILNAQMAEASAFGEKMSTRANEYAELANTFGARAKAVSEEATTAMKVNTAKVV